MIARALLDYYGCPPEFVKMALAGELSVDAGYFRFGPDICYGQTSSGSRRQRPTNRLDDTLPGVTVDEGILQVPFDPSQVIDNLRLERYASDLYATTDGMHQMWQRPYYAVRQYVPVSLRRQLQRRFFRTWKALPFPAWPVDDGVGQILERFLLLSLQSQGISRVPFIWFWPDGASSCAIMTHDVETSVGRDRCSWLMDVDDGYGIKASFQLVPEDRYSISPALLDEIRRRGFEINVHDLNHDGRLFRSQAEFRRRALRINEYGRAFGARGFRSGSLYRRPDWYDAFDLAYDLSIPNTGHLEIQRGGCCTVMPYFIGDLVELPLTTTQDYSLFHILRDFSNEVWKSQMESLTKRHGLLTFLVHPDYLGSDGARRTYDWLLDQLSRLRDAGACWVTLPGEVERWWRQRSQMTLVRDGGGWRVEGPGQERARIAYAVVDGDEIVYTIQPPSRDHDGPATR